MFILALDLATCFGWAYGSAERGPTASSSHRLPKTGEEIGSFLSAFRGCLDSMIRDLQPDEIFFESPILRGKGTTSLGTLRKLYSLAGMTELVALDHGLVCREANISDICTHFLGKGYPRKREARKAATIERCRSRGWQPKDDNHADALALLDYAFATKQPARAIEATPLFGVHR